MFRRLSLFVMSVALIIDRLCSCSSKVRLGVCTVPLCGEPIARAARSSCWLLDEQKSGIALHSG